MHIKKLAMKKSRQTVMMCGLEKLERLMPYTFGDIPDADYIITDGVMPKGFQDKVKESGVVLL